MTCGFTIYEYILVTYIYLLGVGIYLHIINICRA
jgi:hypothetical protein